MTLFRPLGLDGLVEIIPARHGDHRGFFSETYKRADFAAQSIEIDWVQDNHSLSVEQGTIRGLHYQVPPVAQDKLIRVLRGAIFDVAVDIRRGSPTYGQWIGLEISAERHNQLLVPMGFAHGFMTLVPDTEVMYKVSDYWSREHEAALRWDDADLAIAWPDLGQDAILSAKDAIASSFADLETPFEYRER